MCSSVPFVFTGGRSWRGHAPDVPEIFFGTLVAGSRDSWATHSSDGCLRPQEPLLTSRLPGSSRVPGSAPTLHASELHAELVLGGEVFMKMNCVRPLPSRNEWAWLISSGTSPAALAKPSDPALRKYPAVMMRRSTSAIGDFLQVAADVLN